MNPFWALRVHEPTSGIGHAYTNLEQIKLEQLTQGDVTVEVHYSGINFKDALATTGRGKIMKRYPLNAGIDAAGIVIESRNPQIKVGQKVLVAGAGTGESFDGGFAEIMRANSESVVPLPEGLDLREAMILGTAGFTAALALHRMLENHQKPPMGPILVTGASGGVGSFAVQLFSQMGFAVHAVSGKHEAIRYLETLGAEKVIPPSELGLGSRPLESVKYGGVVDNVGGKLLTQAMAHTQLWGNICCIGLADSPDLHATVLPLILRGVSLLGVSSNNTPHELRVKLWNKLGQEWKPRHLERTLTRTVELKDAMEACEDLMHRRVTGRILVRIRQGE